jgi:hypothetical protein
MADSFKRVAVFSSPLRRALGTATMMSSSSCAAVTSPSFVLPIDSQESTTGTSSYLPIVVWDGLCDCAARVNLLGGNRNAVRTGFLHCAANQDFNDDRTTKLQQALKEMRQLADTGLEHAPQQSCPFQLFKVDDQNALVPMAPPVRFFGSRNASSPSEDSSINPAAASCRDEGAPIDQVVRMAIDAGCDACIVVSHREEIRELYRYRCNYQADRRSLPYCCIGRFEVEEEEEESSLRWIMHDVTPFEELTVESVRSMLPLPRKLGKSFELKHPTTNSLPVCCVSLVLDETLPFVDIESCALSGLEMEATTTIGIEVQLELQKFHEEWFQFLHARDSPFASVVGTVAVRFEDDSLHEKQVWIHSIQQPKLPCPPRSIRMHVLF